MKFNYTNTSGENRTVETFVYSDGLMQYGECLHKGTFRIMGFDRTEPDEALDFSFKKFTDREETTSFVIELDGVSLINHWEYLDHDETEEDGCLTVKVHVRHTAMQVEVWVCTKIDGSGCFSRWLEIKNCADRRVSLTRLAIMSGKLEYLKSWQDQLGEKQVSPYRLGYFEDSTYNYESRFLWHDVPSERFSFGGRYTRYRYRHPFCVLENRATGDTYAMQIAYSGGYLFSFDFKTSPAGEGTLAFSCEIDGLKPIRNLDAGETICTPEVIITKAHGDLDDATFQMHNHIRNVYMPKSFKGAMFLQGGFVPTGIENEKVNVDNASKAGIEIYYNDATWFSKSPGNFIDYSGDWEANEKLYPNGYKELTEYCDSKGIRGGLWMEPERVGICSARYEKDQDKFLRNEAGEINHGDEDQLPFYLGQSGFYNLSKKEVCDYVEDMICQVIEESKVKFFRLDCNIEYVVPFSMNWDEGNVEAADYRYHENMYAMWKRIRQKYPDVVFENCASGGGRTDLGIMKYFEHTWLSDHFTPPRRFVIFNGMSMCMPTEILSAGLNTVMKTEYYQILGLFTRSTLGFPEYSEMEHYIDVYKNFARPLLRGCKMYHHTPEFEDPDTKEFGILEAAAPDGTRDMIGLFCHDDHCGEEYVLHCKGVKDEYSYRVTSYHSGDEFIAAGAELKSKGITVTLREAMTADLFMIERV